MEEKIFHSQHLFTGWVGGGEGIKICFVGLKCSRSQIKSDYISMF
mgnify:CR=1 FL=1